LAGDLYGAFDFSIPAVNKYLQTRSKETGQQTTGTFLKIAMVVVVFISCITIIVLSWTVKQHTVGLNLLLVMMGLLLAYMGMLCTVLSLIILPGSAYHGPWKVKKTGRPHICWEVKYGLPVEF
jgi:uncharacterized Tic20 family protein